MREILYRAKVKDKNELIGKGFPIDENGNLKSEWVFGVPIPRYPEIFLAWNEACNEYEEITIISETVGQFTGRKDKNDKKVFEGNVCRFYGGEYYNGIWEFDEIIPITDITNFNQIPHLCNAEYCEIIGNIHDNPELLTQ